MKRQRSVSRRAKQGGNAMIEFALSATLLLTLFIGITGFSRIFNLANMAGGAAEAGIQWGALSPTNSDNLSGIQKAALNDTGNYSGATAVASQFCTCSVGGTQVTCPASCGNNTVAEKYIQVSVTLPYQAVITYPMLPNPINVTQTVCARVQ